MKLNARLLLGISLAVILVVLYFISTSTDENNINSLDKPTTPFISQSELIETLPDFYVMDREISDGDKNKEILANNLVSKIKQSFGKKDMLDFEAELIAILKDPTISRQDKINLLWMMVHQLGVETEQGLYVLEYMATLAPIELSEELAVLFTNASARAKLGLLYVMESILRLDNTAAKVSAEHLDQAKQQMLDTISAQLVNVDNNVELGFSILETVVGYLPFDQAKLLIDDHFMTLSGEQGETSRATKAGIYNRLALANPVSRNEFLPQYIESLSADPKKAIEKEALRQDLFNIIKIDRFIAKAPQEFKNTVKDFLVAELPKIEVESTEFNYDAVMLYADLSIAMAKLQGNDLHSSESLYKKQINNTTNLLEQAILLSRSPYELNTLLPDEYTRLQISERLRAEAKRLGDSSVYSSLLRDVAKQL
ncbi:hypothetical protein [Pseudoalteromonas sp. PS5]|uniref:hypothetical protein n=1 Tax=Pseudoalteromonas sp. PS5 TaxID=1437473 RepID=UPI000FFF4B47|nr:hypothetical protein [Pseudoalteromonas sp. PS5]RXF01569.1 hypothetical protein D9603_13205 [Pseudoalteromonas sp. PS5]